MSSGEQDAFNSQRIRTASTKKYLADYIDVPASARKLLPRDGVYHSPWAYHKAPSYSGLFLDQSEYGERKYDRGIDHLVALGKQPLQEAIAKSAHAHPGSKWTTLLSASDFVGTPKNVIDAASSQNEEDRIIGTWAAIEGMGFDTNDLAFASWEERRNGSPARYTVVPYDSKNELHQVMLGSPAQTISESTAQTIATAKDPGLMIKYSGLSVNVCAVDIDLLRSDKGELIPPTPDLRALVSSEYIPPRVLPSTQIGLSR